MLNKIIYIIDKIAFIYLPYTYDLMKYDWMNLVQNQ